MPSPFLFICCQAGAEKALKAEIARLNPELKLAFSRPGFITFKSPKPVSPEFELQSVFARVYGVSLGRWENPTASLILAELERLTSELGTKPILHLWERDFHPPGEEPKGFVGGELESRVLAELGVSTTEANVDDWILDVVIVEANQWWYGIHRHHQHHSRFPGGRPAISQPQDAPSRAYLKIEEAIRNFEIPLRAGDTAVEVGSAPGGASFALVRRGIRVAGIDPAAMAPLFQKMPREEFFHVQRGVIDVQRHDLPVSVQWLLLDMNVAPRTAIKLIQPLLAELQDTLLGACLTLKLNDWSFAEEIPGLLEDIRSLGFARVRARQLASNAREFCVYALTRKGLAR